MLNSVVYKAAPKILSQAPSYLNRLVNQGARPFSVAFNVKSKFEDAFEKRMASMKTQPQKAYVPLHC